MYKRIKKIFEKKKYLLIVLRLEKNPILEIKPMVVTSLLHGAPQLKLEARGVLKGINPL